MSRRAIDNTDAHTTAWPPPLVSSASAMPGAFLLIALEKHDAQGSARHQTQLRRVFI